MEKINKKTILIIDESDSLGRLIETALGEYHRIVTCSGAKDTREKIKDQQIDLILLEIDLPDMNGFKSCLEFKKNKDISSIPIVLVTGNERDQDVLWGGELGASDYITKPFHSDVLKLRINNILRMKELQQAEVELRNLEFFKQTNATTSHEVNNALAVAYGSYYKIFKKAPEAFKNEFKKDFLHLEAAHERIKIAIRQLKENAKN
jgi:DNA-binding response OmpR family regulator